MGFELIGNFQQKKKSIAPVIGRSTVSEHVRNEGAFIEGI